MFELSDGEQFIGESLVTLVVPGRAPLRGVALHRRGHALRRRNARRDGSGVGVLGIKRGAAGGESRVVMRGFVVRGLLGHLRPSAIARPHGRGRLERLRLLAGHGVAARERIEGVLRGRRVPPSARVVVVPALFALLLGAGVGDVHVAWRGGCLVEVSGGVVEARVGGVVGEGLVCARVSGGGYRV